jgi:hypothetical protein
MIMTVPIRAPLPLWEGRLAILNLRKRPWVTTLVQAMLWVVVCCLVATTGVATHSTTREDAALVQQQLVQLVAQVRSQELAKTHGNVRTSNTYRAIVASGVPL